MWCLTSELSRNFNNLGRTSHTTNEHKLAKFRFRVTGRPEAFFERSDGALVERITDLFELRSSELDVKVLRSASICSDERKIDVCALSRGQCDLRLLCFFLEALKCHLVSAQVDALLLLEFFNQEVD